MTLRHHVAIHQNLFLPGQAQQSQLFDKHSLGIYYEPGGILTKKKKNGAQDFNNSGLNVSFLETGKIFLYLRIAISSQNL